MNFFAVIAETAARHPSATAVEMLGDGTAAATSYRALIARAESVADWLRRVAGIERGDRVAILSANSAEWVAAYLGVLRIGAVAVPLDTAYTPAQVATVLADSGARLIFVSERLAANAAAAVDDSPTDLRAGSGSAVRIARLDDNVAEATVPGAIAEVAPDDAAVILYTSGTTADPKGVVLTHANLHAERESALAVIRVDDRDTILGVLPLFHALAQMTNLLLPLSAGSSVVFLETIDSGRLVAALQARPITVFACVPQFFYLIHQRVMGEVAKRGAVARTIFRGLMALNFQLRQSMGVNLGTRLFPRVHRTLGARIRYLITGGSRFDPAIARDLYGLGLPLLNGYGLTETSGAATVVRPGDRFTTSVGPALPGVNLRISDEDIDDDQAQKTGEVLIRGGIVMREYFQKPGATTAAIRDGWLHTGDLGYLDSHGRLFITGRKKEVIVLASGKNLYPEEIEAHYQTSPFIKELCVLGLTRVDTPSAERLHAVLVPDDDALRARGVVNVGELIRFELEGLSVQLPPHKRVLTYDIAREPLPRTTTGKLKRGDIERRVRTSATTAASSAKPERPLSPDEQEWMRDAARADRLHAIGALLGRHSVVPNDNLELDLGLDSMERVELLTALESREERRVDVDTRATIFTVRQLVDAVLRGEALQAAGHRPQATRDGPQAGGARQAAGSRQQVAGSSRAAWTEILATPADPAIVAALTRPTMMRAAVVRAGLMCLGLFARACIRWRVVGRQHVPTNGPYLICPNHQSYLDGFFVATAVPFGVLRQFFLVGAAEYFQTPLTAWLARGANIVAVDADANLVSAMRAAASGLALGKVLVLFPEGERTIDGEIKPFRKGAAILASHLDLPIVPVAVTGLFEIWPRGRGIQWRRLLPWRRPRVTIAFGPPLRASSEDYVATAEALRAQVAALAASGRDHG